MKLLSNLHMKHGFLNIILFSVFLSLNCLSAEARTYRYDGQARMVGELEYAVVEANCNNLHDLARQYNIGYDALLSANPHLHGDQDLEPGLLVYIPNKIILPQKIKPQTVTINLPEKRMFYFDDSKMKLHVWPVGVGRIDHPTPEGKMYIAQMRYKPTWHVPKGVLAEARKNGFTDHPTIMRPGPDNPLGEYAIHLSAQTYLIHSTNNPDLIGKRNTSGCINLYPEHIADLYQRIHVRSRVEVLNLPLKTYRHRDILYVERYDPLWRTTTEQREYDLSLALHHDIEQITQAKTYHHASSYNNQGAVDNLTEMLQNPVSYPIAIQGL